MFDQESRSKYQDNFGKYRDLLKKHREGLEKEANAADSLVTAKDAPSHPNAIIAQIIDGAIGVTETIVDVLSDRGESTEEEEESSSDDSDTDQPKKAPKGPSVYKRTSVQKTDMTFKVLEDDDYSKNAKEILYVTFFDSACCSMFIRL